MVLLPTNNGKVLLGMPEITGTPFTVIEAVGSDNVGVIVILLTEFGK